MTETVTPGRVEAAHDRLDRDEPGARDGTERLLRESGDDVQ